MGACSDPQYVQAATGNITSLCQAILDSSLVDALINDVNFPTTICHGLNDELITYANIPTDLSPNPNLKLYEPFLPLLGPMGDHQIDHVLCPLDSVYLIASDEGDDTITKIIPLDGPIPAECLADTMSPSMSPNDNPTDGPVSVPTDAPAETPTEAPAESSSPPPILVATVLLPAILFSMFGTL